MDTTCKNRSHPTADHGDCLDCELERLRAELAKLHSTASHAGILRAQEQHNAMMAEKDRRIAELQSIGRAILESVPFTHSHTRLRERLVAAVGEGREG